LSVDVTELIESQQALEAARREIEDMHRLPRDAIEAMPAAVEVYDRTDRLVVFNQRMLAMYPHMAGQPVQGETFDTLVRRALAHGVVPEARGREADWLAERLAERGRRSEPRLQRAPRRQLDPHLRDTDAWRWLSHRAAARRRVRAPSRVAGRRDEALPRVLRSSTQDVPVVLGPHRVPRPA